MKVIKNILLTLAVAVLFATGASFMLSNANAKTVTIPNNMNVHRIIYSGPHGQPQEEDSADNKPVYAGEKVDAYKSAKGGYIAELPGQMGSYYIPNTNASSQSANGNNSANSNSQNSQYQDNQTNNGKLVQTSENKKNKEAAIVGAIFFLAVIGFAYAQHIHMTHVI